MWKEFQNKYLINEKIISVIDEDMKFDKITKVQNVVIPNFIKNRDVIVKSCTGSGKTLSYLIPVFQKLLDFLENEMKDEVQETEKGFSIETSSVIKNKILALIVLPTRELAMQVNAILTKFICRMKFSFALFIGGRKLQKDLDKLDKAIPNIIVATPGRIFDLDEKFNFSFRDLRILILDEADKMLELGFEFKLNLLLGKLPKQRRTGLFSATINSQIENMIKIGMQNPIFVDVKINLENNYRLKAIKPSTSNIAQLININVNTNNPENINNNKEKNKNKKKNKNNESIKIENNDSNATIAPINVNANANANTNEKKAEKEPIEPASAEQGLNEEKTEVILAPLNEEIFIKSVNEDISSYSKVIVLESISEKAEELGNFIQEVPNQLKQFYIGFDNIQDKLPYLMYLIKNNYSKTSKIIIFFATCNCVEYFAIALSKLMETLTDKIFQEKIDDKINIFKLHSKITQKKRNLEYKNFLNCKNGILLSTDLSARGIDVPNVDIIIQYDPPKNEEIYIHRVGRTARVGRQGLVSIIIFIIYYFQLI